MELSEANTLALELLAINNLGKHFERWMICGSIRRQKENVNDIDIVAIEKKPTRYVLGDETLENTIKRIGTNFTADGLKIKRFLYKLKIMIDLYLATPETFETLVLIKTGSTNFNKRLTTTALQKGLKLKAGGEGLCQMNNNEQIIKVIENTEEGIIKYLLNNYVEPEKRF